MSSIFAGLDGAGVRQEFRGLHLRTHPDNDVRKSKVMLVRAAEFIFDDGYRETSGLDRLVADITASGAGGLDTGSEAASAWYEIYAIRKSSDGTKNLLLHRAKNWTGWTTFTTTPDSNRALRISTATATDKLAQGFQGSSPGSNAYIDFVELKLAKANAPTGNLWLTIESDTAGSPSGSVLATSDKIDVAGISTSGQVLRFVFRNPFSPAATTQYHLVLQGDYTRSDTVGVSWQGLVAGGYANGSAKQYNGTAWSAATGVGDFYFSVALRQNDASVTMPTGYDEQCLAGYVYNDSGSDLSPFVAHDRGVSPLTGITIASGFTGTIATLTDLSAIVPPTRCRVRVGFGSDGDNVRGGVAPVPEGYSMEIGATPVLRVGGAAWGRSLGATAPDPSATLAPIWTDYQGCYLRVASGSASFGLADWEW